MRNRMQHPRVKVLKEPKFEKRRWVQHNWSNDIMDWGLKHQPQLQSKGNVNEALRVIRVLELVKLEPGLLSVFQKWVSRLCGGVGNHPIERWDYPLLGCQRRGNAGCSMKFWLHRLKGENWWYASTLFGTSCLKEEAMWHVDPLPSNSYMNMRQYNSRC
jgi:hypothetical protein